MKKSNSTVTQTATPPPAAASSSTPASPPDVAPDTAQTPAAASSDTSTEAPAPDPEDPKDPNKRDDDKGERITFTENKGKLEHIFRKKVGHFSEDTPTNRKIIEDIANNKDNFKGTSEIGTKRCYDKIMQDGRQVWVEVVNGKITGAGINEIKNIRIFDKVTGYCRVLNPSQLASVAAPIAGVAGAQEIQGAADANPTQAKNASPSADASKSDASDPKDPKEPPHKKSKGTVEKVCHEAIQATKKVIHETGQAAKKVGHETGKAAGKVGKETGKAAVKTARATGKVMGQAGTAVGKGLKALKLRKKKKTGPQILSCVEPKGSAEITTTDTKSKTTAITQNADAQEKVVTAQTSEQQSPTAKRDLESTTVGADVAQPPVTKHAKMGEDNGSIPVDARKELARQMAETAKNDPSGYKRILKELRKEAAPVVQKYEEQQAAQNRTTRHFEVPEGASVSHAEFHPDFGRQQARYPSDLRMAAGEGALMFALLNPEIVEAGIDYTARGMLYLCKLSYTSSRDFLTGRTFSYLFGNPVESDIKKQTLDYFEFEWNCINNVDPYEMQKYEKLISWKPIKHLAATFECNIREINEQKQKFEKAVNDAFALLQLPPNNLEEIQKNATLKMLALTGTEGPQDPCVFQKNVIISAQGVCNRYLHRIECAKAAKKDFDSKKFNESEQKLREAILLYNEERVHWINWQDNHAQLNPIEMITKEYGYITDQGNATIKTFTGTHIQQLFHAVIIQEFNICQETSYANVKNCVPTGLESMIKTLLKAADKCNIKNEFCCASYLIKACRELNLFARELSKINTIKCMGLLEIASLSAHSLLNWDAFETKFGIKLKAKIEIKGAPWTTTPPYLDQISEYLSLAILACNKDQADLSERFLPQLIKLFKDLETKQPEALEKALTFVANTLLFGNSLAPQIDEPTKKMLDDLKTAAKKESLINLKIEAVQATAPIKTVLIKTLKNAINKIQTGDFSEKILPPVQQQASTQKQSHAAGNQSGPQNPESASACAGPAQPPTVDKSGDEIEVDIQAMLEDLPRPEHAYVQQAINMDRNDRAGIRALIIQCDEINKTLGFDTQVPNGPSIRQLPGLYQLYKGLELSPEYGSQYGSLCGYYAAHFAKVFASNPHATEQEFIQHLNDRNAFELLTLIPGKDITLINREQIQHVVDLNVERNFSDLLGNEIEQLLPHDVLDRTIVIGNAAETDALHNEQSFIRTTMLTQRFKSGHIDHLIYILPTDGHNHWITVIARREGNNHVQLILSDSVGSDRQLMGEIINIYRDLVSPEQQAAEHQNVPQAPQPAAQQAPQAGNQPPQ